MDSVCLLLWFFIFPLVTSSSGFANLDCTSNGTGGYTVQSVLPLHPFLFGPQSFDLSAELVLPEPHDACKHLSNPDAVRGRVAVVTEGHCMAQDKAWHVQAAGGVGVIIRDSWEVDGILAFSGRVSLECSFCFDLPFDAVAYYNHRTFFLAPTMMSSSLLCLLPRRR